MRWVQVRMNTTLHFPACPTERHRFRVRVDWLNASRRPLLRVDRFPQGVVYRLWLGRLFVRVMQDSPLQ